MCFVTVYFIYFLLLIDLRLLVIVFYVEGVSLRFSLLHILESFVFYFTLDLSTSYVDAISILTIYLGRAEGELELLQFLLKDLRTILPLLHLFSDDSIVAIEDIVIFWVCGVCINF